MGKPSEIRVSFPGGRRVDASIGHHLVRTDQPLENGGTDSAPSPFDVFLASMGACAGLYVQGFCAQRDIPFDDIRLIERLAYHADGTLAAVDIEIALPPDFPAKYRDAVVRSAEGCAVKRALAAGPTFHVHSSQAPSPRPEEVGHAAQPG